MKETSLDGILGHSAHVLQGVEIINGKPVIYDAGNLLLDYSGKSWQHYSYLFELHLGKDGIKNIRLLPIEMQAGKTTMATGTLADQLWSRFKLLSQELGTELSSDGFIQLAADRGNRPSTEQPKCVLDEVPADAQECSVKYANGMQLIAHKIHRQTLTRGQGFFVSTYWTTTRRIENSYMISIRLKPADSDGPVWGNRDTLRDHQPGDWSHPTQRWLPGQIIEDRYFVRGHKRSAAGKHDLLIGLYDTRDASNVLKIQGKDNLLLGSVSVQ